MKRYDKRSLKRGGEKEPLKVVKGKKLERRRRFKILLSALAVMIIALIVFEIVSPAGIAESVSNFTASMGSGSYPIELSGSDTLNCISSDNYYYVLTDTALAAYSGAGKQMFKRLHGYSSPVLKTSETRALIFDQNGVNAVLLTASGKEFPISSKKGFLTACVARNGGYAVAELSDSYASTVTVFDKNGNKLYVWNSAKDTVTAVALSPKGDKLAVAMVNAESGQLNSKVYVLGFESADPLYTENISGEAVMSLENAKKGFCVLTSRGMSIIDWSEHKKTDIHSDLTLDMFRSSKSGMTLVFNRANDKSDNRITVVSGKGEKLSEFVFGGTISDIAYAKGHIYIVSDTKLYLYDSEGKLIRSVECGYGCRRLSVSGSGAVCVMTDSEIKKLEVKE